MKFFTRIIVLFYVTLIMFIGVSILLLVLNILNLENIVGNLRGVYHDHELRLFFGILALIILFMNFLFYKMFSVNTHREKIIAFDNPSGRVSVSLVALEDMIKRKLFKLPEINEVKPTIVATKKGLFVKLRIVFASEINIPEATSKVQEIVKRKVHDTIGIDEPVNITIYVGKIMPEQVNEKDLSAKLTGGTEPSEANIPFRNYRA